MGKQSEVYPHGGILLSHKKEKLSTHTVTWMSFKIIMLSEISKMQKECKLYNSTYTKFSMENSPGETDS